MTETILEINSKELAIHLSNSLDYVTKRDGIIFNSIFISGEFIAASEGAKMIINNIDKTSKADNFIIDKNTNPDNFVIVDGDDIRAILAALETLNKIDKYGFLVTIEKVDNSAIFTVKDKYKTTKFKYFSEIQHTAAPRYKECIPENKKVLGIFSKKSLLKAMAEIKGKYNKVTKQVYLSKDSISCKLEGIETIMPIDGADFDENTIAASFNFDMLLTLVKTHKDEGIILYTNKNAERSLTSPVWIEEEQITAVIMPLRS